MEFNAAERRALRLAVGLVVLGTLVRLGFGPGPASYAWVPASPAGSASGAGAASGAALGAVRRAVDGNLERERRAARPLAPGERIDPNGVDAVELRRLPGVGPATAEAILRRRAEAGPFRHPEDLLSVRGIGPATLARIAPHLDLPPEGARGGAEGEVGTGAGAGTGARAGARTDPRRGVPAGSRTRVVRPLDLNRAGAAELTGLPGVGPVLARRILETRRRLGEFRSVEDLLEVAGIGPARLEALRGRITVGPP